MRFYLNRLNVAFLLNSYRSVFLDIEHRLGFLYTDTFLSPLSLFLTLGEKDRKDRKTELIRLKQRVNEQLQYFED